MDTKNVWNRWLPVILVIVIFVFLWLLYPSDRRSCSSERYRPFPPMQLYNPQSSHNKNMFVVRPTEAAYYYSTMGFPAYLCDGGQRYCYN